MLGTETADTAAGNGANGHRHMGGAAGHVALLGRVVYHLVQADPHAIAEHDLGYRAHAHHCSTGSGADNGLLGDRCRPDAFTPLGLHALETPEHTARLADVLTEEKHRVVQLQGQFLGILDRLEHRHFTGFTRVRRFLCALFALPALRHHGGIGVYVEQHFVLAAHLAGHGGLHRLLYLGSGGLVDLRELLLATDALIQQQCAGARHGPGLLGRREILLGEVIGVADAGVGAQAHGHRLDKDRAVAAAHLVDNGLHAVVEGHRVIAVQLHPLETVGFRPAGEVLARGVFRDGRVLAHLVVLAEEDHRELPNAGEVHRLVDSADTGGAVAEIDNRHRLGAAHLARQGEAVGDGRSGADDGRGEHGPGGGIGDMR